MVASASPRTAFSEVSASFVVLSPVGRVVGLEATGDFPRRQVLFDIYLLVFRGMVEHNKSLMGNVTKYTFFSSILA